MKQYVELIGVFLEQYEKAKRLVEKLDAINNFQERTDYATSPISSNSTNLDPPYFFELEELKKALKKLEDIQDPNEINLYDD